MPRRRRTPRKRLLGETLTHSVLLFGAAVVLLPFVLMVSTSLKSPVEIATGTGGLLGSQAPMLDEVCAIRTGDPDGCMVAPVVHNYTRPFVDAPLLRYLLNGIIVTVSIFVLQILVALPAAYALSKLRWWGREAVFALVLFCLLIPVQAIGVPLYLMLAHVGLLNSYAALILPWTISVFGIFLMRQFFRTVPDDLVDAARIDGMGEFTIVWHVMAPTAVPALLAFAIFSVTAHWNDYFWPRVAITGDPNLFTPPLGIREFRDDVDGTEYGPLMASATIIVLPLVFAFLFAQRRFIQGITLSGMK